MFDRLLGVRPLASKLRAPEEDPLKFYFSIVMASRDQEASWPSVKLSWFI